MVGHPWFLYTQNLHLGHCLNLAPFAKLKNDLSYGFIPMQSLYSAQLIFQWNSHLHLRQYLCLHFLQEYSEMEESNSKRELQSGVGHHEVFSPFFYTYWFIIKSWYFCSRSGVMKFIIQLWSIYIPQYQLGHLMMTSPLLIVFLTCQQMHWKWQTWVQSRMMTCYGSMTSQQIVHQFYVQLRLIMMFFLGSYTYYWFLKQFSSSNTWAASFYTFPLNYDIDLQQSSALVAVLWWLFSFFNDLTIMLTTFSQLMYPFEIHSSQKSIVSRSKGMLEKDRGIPKCPITNPLRIMMVSLGEVDLVSLVRHSSSFIYTYSNIYYIMSQSSVVQYHPWKFIYSILAIPSLYFQLFTHIIIDEGP